MFVDEKLVSSAENNNILALKNAKQLDELLNQSLNFSNENIEYEINKRICEIYCILEQLYKNDKFELSLKHFFRILVYYNYLISQVCLKIYNSENIEIIQNVSYFNLFLDKYKKALSLLKKEKHVIYKLAKPVLQHYNKIVRLHKNFFEIKVLHFFLKNFLFFDEYYNFFYDIITLKYCSKQLNKIKSKRLMSQAFNFLKIDCIFSDACENDGFYFLTNCILLSRIFLIYSCATKSFAKSIEQFVLKRIEFNNFKINKMLEVLKKNQNMQTIKFLRNVREKNMQKLLVINQNIILDEYKNTKKNIKNFVKNELLYEINLYEEAKDLLIKPLELLSKICYLQKTNTFKITADSLQTINVTSASLDINKNELDQVKGIYINQLTKEIQTVKKYKNNFSNDLHYNIFLKFF